jgi:hypothetical protein
MYSFVNEFPFPVVIAKKVNKEFSYLVFGFSQYASARRSESGEPDTVYIVDITVRRSVEINLNKVLLDIMLSVK